MTSDLGVVHKQNFSLYPGPYQPMGYPAGAHSRGSLGSFQFYHNTMVYNSTSVDVLNDAPQLPLSSVSFHLSLTFAVQNREDRLKNNIPSGVDGLGSKGDPRR